MGHCCRPGYFRRILRLEPGAAGYDEGLEAPARCRRLHEQWLAALPCRVLRIEGAGDVDSHLVRILAALPPT